jgi:AcrR family transcriptional regulator
MPERNPAKAAPRRSPAKGKGTREQSAQTTRDNILKAATKVFARYGYDGGSVEKISAAAKSVDRMIYYYFGSKEGLFIEVIEAIYHRMNEAEAALEIRLEAPVEALMALVRFVSQYYRKHPEFVTLLNTENLHKGKHISKSLRARDYSSPAVSLLDQVLQSGAAAGVFRKDLLARDLYLVIASMGYFYQSNRFTLSAFLGEDMDKADAIAHWDAVMADVVMRAVAP